MTIADDRRRRLLAAMADDKLDALLVYGNAWQGDYLRYTTDYAAFEGQALALVRGDGHVTLYLDSPLEVDRASLDCPDLEIVHAPKLLDEVDQALDRFRNQRVGAAPWRLPWEGAAPPSRASRWRGRLGRRPAQPEMRRIWAQVDRQPAWS